MESSAAIRNLNNVPFFFIRLYQMTPRSSQSDIVFKLKLRVKLKKINDLDFVLEGNI